MLNCFNFHRTGWFSLLKGIHWEAFRCFFFRISDLSFFFCFIRRNNSTTIKFETLTSLFAIRIRIPGSRWVSRDSNRNDRYWSRVQPRAAIWSRPSFTNAGRRDPSEPGGKVTGTCHAALVPTVPIKPPKASLHSAGHYGGLRYYVFESCHFVFVHLVW